MAPQPTTETFTASSREEIEVPLDVFEGNLPTDLIGHVFINSPCGTVNNPTPIPATRPDQSRNQEWGNMIFNGDAMLFRFDLNRDGQMWVKSGLLKTPCYWADFATRYESGETRHNWPFKALGMSRTSGVLGVRNQINTSLTAFRFEPHKPTRLTANFDAGRPFEIDPVHLTVKTAVGYCREWPSELPFLSNLTFPLIQSTAHPSFDPKTYDYFSLGFQKSLGTLLRSRNYGEALLGAYGFVEDEISALENHILFNKDQFLEKPDILPFFYALFIDYLYAKIENPTLRFDPGQVYQDLISNKIHAILQNTTFPPDAVTLLRWNGAGLLDRWNVIEEGTNANVRINQTMHQTNFSRDYIILVDSSVKFAIDVLINVPFHDYPLLSRLLRKLTSKAIDPVTPIYIIKRSDLKPNTPHVMAKKVMLPLETVHFSIDYENPNEQITIHTAHNSASCVSEWVRPYDTLAVHPNPAFDGRAPRLENTIGLMATGETDIGRIGKFIIDGRTGQIINRDRIEADLDIICEKGFVGNDMSRIGAHTWAVGLNTYRDQLSADVNVAKICYNFWQCYGLDFRMLTNFMTELYGRNYANRRIDFDDLLDYTRHGVPFCLARQNTETMKLEDVYVFQMNQNLRSIQFVPRQHAPEDVPVHHPQLDGYIFCTLVNGHPTDLYLDWYSREIWLFDAADLARGPICKLTHPALIYAFTIHSVWTPDCQSSNSAYNVNVEEDYQEVISHFKDEQLQAKVTEFMQKHVYPKFHQDALSRSREGES